MPEVLKLFRGPTAVREQIKKHLVATVPGYIQMLRDHYGLTVDELPNIGRYDAYEPLTLDHGSPPIIGINVPRTNTFTMTDLDPNAGEEYRPTYYVNIFLWLYSPLDPETERPIQPEYDQTIRTRDDLSAAIRAALLHDLSFGNEDLIQHDSNRMEEIYTDTVPVKGNRWTTGTQWTIELRVDEGIYRESIGEVENFDPNFAYHKDDEEFI